MRRKLPTFETFQLINLCIGIFWIAPRVYAAMVSNSVGILGDAVQHVVEVTFSCMVFFSLRAVQRSSALLFPHGTGKFEAMANGLLAFSMVLSGVAIIVAAGLRVLNPEPTQGAGFGLVVLAMSFAITLSLFLLTRPLEQTGRTVVRIWRRLLYLDLFLKSSTIAFVFLSGFGGIFAYLDPIAALIIGILMIRFGFHALRDSIFELSDRALEEEIQIKVMASLADNFDAFDEFIDVRTRRTGGKPVIEIFLGYGEDRTWSEVTKAIQGIESQMQSAVAGASIIAIPRAV